MQIGISKRCSPPPPLLPPLVETWERAKETMVELAWEMPRDKRFSENRRGSGAAAEVACFPLQTVTGTQTQEKFTTFLQVLTCFPWDANSASIHKGTIFSTRRGSYLELYHPGAAAVAGHSGQFPSPQI